MDKKELLLYAITDCDNVQGEELLRRTEMILANGATMLQYRDKHGKAKDDVLALKALCQKYKVPFIINDNVALAKEIDADGVHVGQDDMAAENARATMGPNKIVGVTAKTLEQAKKAVAAGADYLGCGALFKSPSKDSSVISRDTIKEICAQAGVPVVGIGGVGESNVSSLAATGIAGISVISALYAYANPSLVTKRLARKVSIVVNGDPALAGLLCDVDGTLTDTLAFYQDLVPGYLRENGYRPGGDLPVILADKTLPESVAYVKHNYSGRFGVGELADQLEADLEWYYHTEGKAKEGVKEFLTLAQEKGLAVVATSIHDTEVCRTLFEHAGIDRLIRATASGWDKRLPGGDSALFVVAKDMLDAYGNVWAFNDGIEGVFGAKGAGCMIAAVKDPNHDEKHWQSMIQASDVAFENWQEATAWLASCKA